MALPSQTPLQAVYCWQPRLAEAIQTRLVEGMNGEKFDVVHVEHLRGARYGIFESQNGQVPVIWDSVDSISHLFRQTASQTHKLSSRLMAGFELKRTEYYESKVARLFSRVLVTSPVDRQAFLSLPGSIPEQKVKVLPNGVDLKYFTPGEPAERVPQTIVISGKMSYHANVTMTLFLVNDIMQKVWQRAPDVRVWVVGKDPPQEVQALAANRLVTVTGTVSDVRPYLQRASLAAAPIRYGAGIQNKVLEAMACATPVIASSQAISALNVKPEEEILAADQADEFAYKILGLLADIPRQRKLGQAGRNFVEREHSWRAVAGMLERYYQEAIIKKDY
jgi:glycosyltransferase involved in cell wall biosynthesis